MNGLVLINKPSGCTSHDVVNRWRRLADTRRVGHLGTLDPMATGLLALVTGTATRLAQFYGKEDKTYRAEIAFGKTSNTYDAEGDVVETGAPIPDSHAIRAALESFKGRLLQTPPPVSAKKINGVPAYKLARKHIAVELKPVEVEVKSLEIESEAPGKIVIVVTCTAGTYIRSIAHDLGRQLGCGALLSCLQRTRSGEFTLDQARSLEQLAELAGQGRLSQAVIPAANMLAGLPFEYFDSAVVAQIRQGRDFRTSPFVVPPGAPLVKALSHAGELVAIGELKIPNLYHPGTVL